MGTAQKIFIGNYKGGVGKTTSIYQIARHMVNQGKRVLLIDLDPQCSLSEICLARIDLALDKLRESECLNLVYDIWSQFKNYPNVHIQFDLDSLIKHTPEEIDFIPSNIFYRNGGLDEIALRMKDDFEDLLILQQFFQKNEIDSRYDIILFDCPPSNNMITQGAFLLSDYYLIPTIIQTLSIRGVVHYITTVERLYDRHCEKNKYSPLARMLFGDKPKLLGIFETLKKGTVKNHEVVYELKSHLKSSKISSILSDRNPGQYIFDTVINNYEDIARDTAKGNIRPEYGDLTDEILGALSFDKGWM